MMASKVNMLIAPSVSRMTHCNQNETEQLTYKPFDTSLRALEEGQSEAFLYFRPTGRVHGFERFSRRLLSRIVAPSAVGGGLHKER